MGDDLGQSPTSQEWRSADDLLPGGEPLIDEPKNGKSKNAIVYFGLVLLIVILAVVFGFYLLKQRAASELVVESGVKTLDQTQSAASGEVEQKYVSQKYGFGFTYPREATIDEFSDDWVGVAIEKGLFMTVLVVDDELGMDFDELIANKVSPHCSGDRHGLSVYCAESFDRVESFTNQNDEKGFVGQLELITESTDVNGNFKSSSEFLQVYFFALDHVDKAGVAIFAVVEDLNQDVELLAESFFVTN